MSNKTEVLSFDDWVVNAESWSEHDCFEAGQQSRKAEIDELKTANHNLSVMAAEAESYSEYWKYERDKLQKKIDDAWIWCEKGCILKAMEILKGEETK